MNNAKFETLPLQGAAAPEPDADADSPDLSGYAKTSDLMTRWDVDRQTARKAICRTGIERSALHTSPRYPWAEILRKIECWPDDIIAQVDIAEPLQRAVDLAEKMSVSPPPSATMVGPAGCTKSGSPHGHCATPCPTGPKQKVRQKPVIPRKSEE